MSYEFDPLDRLLAEQAEKENRQAEATAKLSDTFSQLLAELAAEDNKRTNELSKVFKEMLAEF